MDEYFCPNCGATLNSQPGFDPNGGTWTCTECGQLLMDDDVYNGDAYEGVAWFCDECGALLNKQAGFSDIYGSWACTECGHTNGTTKDDIIGEDGFSCPQCGAILDIQSGFSKYSDDWECLSCGAHLYHSCSDDPYTVVESDDVDQDDEMDDDSSSSPHPHAHSSPRSSYRSERSVSAHSYTSSGRQTNQNRYRAPEASARQSNNTASKPKRGRAFSRVMFILNASIMALGALLAIANKRITMLPGLLTLGVLTAMFFVISRTPKKAKYIFGRTQGTRKWFFILICLAALYILPRIAVFGIDFASTIPVQRGLTAMERNASFRDSVATPEYVYDVVMTGGAVITEYRGAATEISIPSKLGGHPVIRIADHAFQDCISLQSISMLADITEIGDYTFAGCSNLQDIDIPSSTKRIGAHAFEGCTALSDVSLWNAGIIGDYAFAGCTALTNISIPSDTSVIGAHAFEGCTGITDLTIWDAAKIEEYAFAGCTGIIEITFHSGTESIGAHAFDGCVNLEEVNFLNDAIQVDSTAFMRCPKLENASN